jgi:hypothetical protein
VKLVALLLVLSLACGGSYGPSAPPVPLTVVNRNWLDVVVYVVRDGQQIRVGTVTGTSTAHLWLRDWMMGTSRTIRLYADPVGSGDFAATELLSVQRGQGLEWWLETQLDRSSVMVW